ncbi:MAG: tetratricopeptide repeat protein, partial [Chloroflexi bacterium]|nr:tetratricopeptide repeat protein [Chloroflexota bacterium]
LKVNPIYIAAGVGAVVLVVAVIVLINAIGAAQERAEIAAQPTPIPPTITDTPTPTVTPRPTRTPIPESLSLTPEPTVTLGAAPRGDLAFGITPTSPYVATPHGSSPLTGAINAFYRADYEMALDRIAEAREAGETPEDLYYIEGRTLLALGETEEAVEVLQEGLDLYPGFAPLHAALGLAYAQQGRFEQARAANEEAQQRDPLLLEAYIQQAELFLRQGDPDSAAIELFEARGLDRYTYDVRLITTEARLNLVREDIERAVALSRLGYYIDPSSEEVNITLAESRLELGLVQTALVGLEDYLYNVYPSSALGWTLLAEAYQQVGRFDDALFAYQRAFQLDEDLFRARIGRGTYYADRAEYDLALVDFNGAVRAEPDNPQARLGRARTLSELGRYEDAVSDYATYFELLGIDPVEATSEQLDVLVDYITTLAESGQTETVLELADNTLSTELSAAQSAALAEARAVALLEEGEPEDALQAIEDALALEETGARHYRRGLILEELEEYEAAIRDFEWVLFWDNVYGFPFAADAALRIDDLQDLLAELEDEAP